MRIAVLMMGIAFALSARSEPYFAVQTGLKCGACHVNPTGGGMRNAFGEAWSQTLLPAHHIDLGSDQQWTGELNRFVALGGNLRTNFTFTDAPHSASQTAFDITEARLYLEVRAIPDRFSVYLDERVAPGGSINSEAFGRIWFGDRHYYVQAGQMYLPYGIRLQDDTAFIRQVPGINFATPDRGVMFGVENGPWTAQLAVTNGSGGASETDSGKQTSLRAERVMEFWRIGASFNLNNSSAGKRQMQNIFAGVRTGPVAWLAEADYILDSSFTPRRKQLVGFIEADWKICQGQNLKLTAESFDPDRNVAADQQARYSLVWEYTPIQFAQLRLGLRRYSGIPQNNLQNRGLAFVELNAYF
jgi:hypothetical protein